VHRRRLTRFASLAYSSHWRTPSSRSFSTNGRRRAPCGNFQDRGTATAAVRKYRSFVEELPNRSNRPEADLQACHVNGENALRPDIDPTQSLAKEVPDPEFFQSRRLTPRCWNTMSPFKATRNMRPLVKAALAVEARGKASWGGELAHTSLSAGRSVIVSYQPTGETLSIRSIGPPWALTIRRPRPSSPTPWLIVLAGTACRFPCATGAACSRWFRSPATCQKRIGRPTKPPIWRSLNSCPFLLFPHLTSIFKLPALPVHLSNREEQCLLWAARAKTYQEIAAILGLAFSSVKTHLGAARPNSISTNAAAYLRNPGYA